MSVELNEFQRQEFKEKLADLQSERQRRARERHLGDIRDVVKTVQGRRMYWKHLEEAGYFTLSFVPGQGDSTAFNEGQRKVGKTMFEDLWEADPQAFFQMKRENDSEVRTQQIEEQKLKQEVARNG